MLNEIPDSQQPGELLSHKQDFLALRQDLYSAYGNVVSLQHIASNPSHYSPNYIYERDRLGDFKHIMNSTLKHPSKINLPPLTNDLSDILVLANQPVEFIEQSEDIRRQLINIDHNHIPKDIIKLERPDVKNLKVFIRWMIRRDMGDVFDIENSTEHPWVADDFFSTLRQRNNIGMVAEYDQRVVGFMIYELRKSSLKIFNLATHPTMRRLTVGTQLISKLIGKLSSHRRTHLEFDVRETNLPLQQFLRAKKKQQLPAGPLDYWGVFTATEVIREHFEDTGEDAYRMVYSLDDQLP